ncbi:MAG: hypothetical protein IKN63_04420 [Bacilli bacterium]|nr:hypothetical protein [Bacilli bacterium]
MIYIIGLIVIIIDYLISYFIPIYFNNLNYFFPMLTLTFLVFIFKKNKDYIKLSIMIGIIYDLLFSYIFLFNTLIFVLFAKILKKVDKLIRYNYIVSIVMLVFFIFLYDLILFGLVYLSEYNGITINDLINKFSHSLVLNLSFYFLLTIIFYKKKILK